MNNNNFQFTEAGNNINCAATNFPSNFITPEQSAAVATNAASGYFSQPPHCQPCNFYPQLIHPPVYGGQIHPQLIPSGNMLPSLPQNNQSVISQQTPTMVVPAQFNGFQHMSPELTHMIHNQNLPPPYSVINQDPLTYAAHLQDQLRIFPNSHQGYFPQPYQNVCPLVSNQGFFPHYPLEIPFVPFDPSTVLSPNIRQCISFEPLEEKATIHHSVPRFREFVAGLQGGLESTKIESQGPSNTINFVGGHQPSPESQNFQIAQASAVSHVEVPCSITDLTNKRLQLCEVNFHFSGMHQTCKVVFFLENSHHSLSGSLTARVSSRLDINQSNNAEDEIENHSPPASSATKQDNAETANLDSDADTALSEIHCSIAASSTPKKEANSSSQDSVSDDTSQRSLSPGVTHEESNEENEKDVTGHKSAQ